MHSRTLAPEIDGVFDVGNVDQGQTFLGSFLKTEYEGRPGVLGWFTDISKIKEAEAAILRAKQAAEDASRAKGEFLANMRPWCCTSWLNMLR